MLSFCSSGCFPKTGYIYIIEGDSKNSIVVGASNAEHILCEESKTLYIIMNSYDIINDLRNVRKYCDRYFIKKCEGEYYISYISKKSMVYHISNIYTIV